MIKYIPKHTSKNPRGHIYNIPKLSTFTQKIIKITCIYKYVDRQEEQGWRRLIQEGCNITFAYF